MKSFFKKIIISILIGLGLGLIIGIGFVFVNEDFDLERYIDETQVIINKTKNKSLKLYWP